MWYLHLCDYNFTSCNYRHACGAYHNTGHRCLDIPSQRIPMAFSNKFRVWELSAPPAELSVKKHDKTITSVLLNSVMKWIHSDRESQNSLRTYYERGTFFVHHRTGSTTTRRTYFWVLTKNNQSQNLYIHVTVHRNSFLLNNQPDALIIQIYSVIKLLTFRASSMPIIKSFLLYIRHWWWAEKMPETSRVL
jgi:hypothetical protein